MLGRVLITGLNGYIAAHTAALFLKAGHIVRGTVRSSANAELVVRALSKFHDGSKLEVVTVPDITCDGAFDRAVEDVQTIAHLASPVSMTVTEPEAMIRAAVKGTTSLLVSAVREYRRNSGRGVLKTVIFMSSISAVFDPTSPSTRVFTDSSWNQHAEAATPQVLKRLKEQGPGSDDPALGYLFYQATKVAAERAFWRFAQEIIFPLDMIAFCPAPVLGPPLYLPESISKLSMRVRDIYDILHGGPIPEPSPVTSTFVDVRDVAQLVFNAAEDADPGLLRRHRYLVVGQSPVSPQAIANVLREKYPERQDTIREGNPNWLTPLSQRPAFDVRMARELLGRESIGFRQSVVDSAEVFLAAEEA
ncbi:uncharacterized protein B0T15DRAFT_386674 [Chaetomium strumarium]|uniref:NAD(P)-binding domain-containing protein n=1 Tax=Chaetomium strumarium TaxID=1170767 RepID=A0AAJ0M798_9PEZI|nr:hypothetical protein B0T15DRAFT_386674 [Chaetomium strumarium]